MWLRPAEAIQVDPPSAVEPDALRLEERALDLFEGSGACPLTDLAPCIDYSVPGDVAPVREGRHRVPDLAGPAGQPGLAGDRAIRYDPAGRDSADDVVEAIVG